MALADKEHGGVGVVKSTYSWHITKYLQIVYRTSRNIQGCMLFNAWYEGYIYAPYSCLSWIKYGQCKCIQTIWLNNKPLKKNKTRKESFLSSTVAAVKFNVQPECWRKIEAAREAARLRGRQWCWSYRHDTASWQGKPVFLPHQIINAIHTKNVGTLYYMRCGLAA